MHDGGDEADERAERPTGSGGDTSPSDDAVVGDGTPTSGVRPPDADSRTPGTGVRTPASDDRPTPASEKRRLICNPTSGREDHVEQVQRLAARHGFDVLTTEYEGHAVELARAAGREGVDLLGVAGGDGTLHEVVQGLVDADALEDVALGVVPVGTENVFATNVGVDSIEAGFEVLAQGERRRLDVGFAGDEPFVMSCIAGLPAETSVATSSDLKAKLGSLAFVVSGIREMASFDGLHVRVRAISKGEETQWEGEAVCCAIGNVRRFVNEGGQANVEDGLFEVVVIEQMPTHEMVTEATAHRLMGQDTEHVVHVQASQVEIAAQEPESLRFSFDGELRAHERLTLHCRPQAVTVCVGDDYRPEGAG